LEIEKVAVAIKGYRRSLGFPDDMEFKFHKSRPEVRDGFLRTVNPFSFSVRSVVFDKKLIHSPELTGNKNSFYSYAIKSVLKYSNKEILDAHVRIDGGGDRIFRRNFLTYLRKHLNSEQVRIMKNCKLVNSKNNVLIQMADMIAGSIRRAHELNKKDSSEYKKIFAKHIVDEWKFK
ncbi:MAG TPA: DUF3800 domain-containing protein, partial [Candidatus Paceibacterota bacterium]|nr:DUF3800 domain-containing protein [Candidatus Paceibacterota bacterium]